MRGLLFIPLPVVALLLGFGMSAVGQGHAQAPVQFRAEGSTITQSFTFSGPSETVSTTGQVSFIAILQEKLADGSAASESDAGTVYPPGANGCSAQTVHGTRTLAAPAGTYDVMGVNEVCPVPAHAVQSKTSGNAVISGGTGRYKDARGTETYTLICTLVPPKPGQPVVFNCNGKGTARIALAGR